jgi:septal ring factor EnvC (AmiA/AmiB activator)
MLGPKDMRLTIKRTFVQACAGTVACLLMSSAYPAKASTDDSVRAKAKLAAVRSKIADLTGRMGKELKQRDALSARLREAELAITEKRRHLDELRAEQAAAEQHRGELLAEKGRDENAITAQRAALATQVRAAYMIGRQEELKLLLNQDSPAAMGRNLTYYRYFAEQRTAKIAVIQDDLQRLQQLVAEIDAQNAQLKALADDTLRGMAALQSARADRADSLAAISKQLANGTQELAKLKREEQAVESLVADLARVLQDFPTDPSQSFGALRGKLPWPVEGHVSAHYQAPRTDAGGAMRWNGVMIAAPHGAKVRAPYFGRVVYADWLQGLGLLLIIGHSGGYMTLYGHAEVLYKAVGDKVAPGEGAAMADTGPDPQLYFEIREGRKTVDPKAWLKGAP